MNPLDAIHHREENLVSELRRVLRAVEEFAETTARDSGEKRADARKQFSATLKDAHRHLGDAESLVRAKTKVAAATTEAYVRTTRGSPQVSGRVLG